MHHIQHRYRHIKARILILRKFDQVIGRKMSSIDKNGHLFPQLLTGYNITR